MSGIWKKLNLKDQEQVVVVNAPLSFEDTIESLSGVIVSRDLSSAGNVQFLLAFVTRQEDIADLVSVLAPRAQGDPVVWFAYPSRLRTLARSGVITLCVNCDQL